MGWWMLLKGWPPCWLLLLRCLLLLLRCLLLLLAVMRPQWQLIPACSQQLLPPAPPTLPRTRLPPLFLLRLRLWLQWLLLQGRGQLEEVMGHMLETALRFTLVFGMVMNDDAHMPISALPRAHPVPQGSLHMGCGCPAAAASAPVLWCAWLQAVARSWHRQLCSKLFQGHRAP